MNSLTFLCTRLILLVVRKGCAQVGGLGVVIRDHHGDVVVALLLRGWHCLLVKIWVFST